MTQDERWQAQYDQMMTFMNENHRRPSKHRLEEHDMLNWYKHVKKAIAKGNYTPYHKKNRIPFLKLPKIQKFSDSIPKTSNFSSLFGFHS